MVERRKTNQHIAAIIDGGMTVTPDIGGMAIVGSARVYNNGVRSGSFTIFQHLGDGVRGPRQFTGYWNCDARRSPS